MKTRKLKKGGSPPAKRMRISSNTKKYFLHQLDGNIDILLNAICEKVGERKGNMYETINRLYYNDELRDMLEVKDIDGLTPLNYSCKNNQNIDKIRLLLDLGANLETKDEIGKTPLNYVTITNFNQPSEENRSKYLVIFEKLREKYTSILRKLIMDRNYEEIEEIISRIPPEIVFSIRNEMDELSQVNVNSIISRRPKFNSVNKMKVTTLKKKQSRNNLINKYSEIMKKRQSLRSLQSIRKQHDSQHIPSEIIKNIYNYI